MSANWYNSSRQDFVLAAITSVIPKEIARDSWLLPEREAKQAGLLYASVVKVGKIFTMQQSLAIRSLGKLPAKTNASILKQLAGVFKDEEL